MATREEVRQRMQDDGVQYLLTQFVDINGAPKVKMVPASHLDDVIDEGAGFAGAALLGMGQGPHSHDMLARVDLDSYTPVPWKDGFARFASDLYVDDEPYMFCPRQNFKRVLSEVRNKGYEFYIGIEPEHFLVTRASDGSISVWDPNEIDTLDKPCYDFKGICNVLDYLRDMMDGMARVGWDAYQSDHEDANGQYEINFVYSDALTTADRYTFFKMMTSQFAQKHGAIATHMAKPFTDRTGSGGHIHYHLEDASTGENVFLDESDARGLGLSEMAYHFIGGVFAPRARSVRGNVSHGQLLQAAPGRGGPDGLQVGIPVDAGFHLLRRQQQDPNDPHRRSWPPGGPHDVGGVQSVPCLGGVSCGWHGWRGEGIASRRAEPYQHVRSGAGRDRSPGHTAAAADPQRVGGRTAVRRGGAGRAGSDLRRVRRAQGGRVEGVPQAGVAVGA